MELDDNYGALAQSVEHLTFNQVVGGSNPPCFTRRSRDASSILFNMVTTEKSVVYMRMWRNWQTR